MKNLFLLLFIATALFTSCSSDDDNFAQTEPNPVVKTYPVELNIKSSAFNIDKTPLTKSTSVGDARFLQIIAYKESGEVYSDSIIYKTDLQTIIKEDSTVSLNIDLPVGNYNLAIFSIGNRYGQNSYEGSLTYPIGPIEPKNYNTDEYRLPCTSIMGFPSNNTGLYYYTNTLSVSSNGNNSLDNIILEPMWSDIKITLKDLNFEEIPTGATALAITFRPNYLQGFNLKTELALSKRDDGFPSGTGMLWEQYYNLQMVNIKDVPNEVTLNYVAAKGKVTDMSLLIEYITTNNVLQGYIVMGSQEFKLPNKFENGKSYNISGRLNVSTGNSSLNLKVSELNPSEIEIPFE